MDLFDANFGNPISEVLEGDIGIHTIHRTFSYDAQDQLISEPGISHTFDSNHNPSYETNLLDELNTCTYDLRGNLTHFGDTTYSYDALNRLIHVNTPSQEINYTYDPLHRLISKNDEFYIWDGTQEVGTNHEKRILNPLTTQALFIEKDEETYLPIFDACNHLRLLINTSTGEITQHDYTAFGTPITPPKCAWGFASTRYDSDTGLYYHHHRYYHPTLKRWLTLDPAGFIDGTNLYTYVKNNPNRYNDPTGKFFFFIPLVFWGAGAATTVTMVSWATISAVFVDSVFVSLGAVGCYAAGKMFNQDQHYNHPAYGDSLLLYNMSQYTEYPQLSYYGSLHHSKNDVKKEPPYNGKDLGADSSKCPGEGFEWKGKDSPGGKRGSWHNEGTQESLHPDLNHPPPKKPHWDYEGPNYPKGVRLNLDGTWEPK